MLKEISPKEPTKVVVVSAFIPPEGTHNFTITSELSIEDIKKIINDYCHREGKPLEIYTQHETVKLLGLEPAKERKVFTPTGNELQIWLKPKGRLEFGREYTLEELQQIGVIPFVAIPME